MKFQSKKMAVCSMTAAVGVVILLLGGVLGLGMDVCPLLVGLCLMPIGRLYGVKYQLMLWIVISLLSLLLVPNPEENLMFAGIFGWYPALYPKLQKLPKVLRWVVKLLLFNGIVIALEALVMLVLVPEVIGDGMLLLLLLMGNVVFVMYDRVLPNFEANLTKRWKHIFRIGD